MADQTATVAELRKLVADFVAERRWQGYRDPKNLGLSIAIKTAERR